MGRLGRYLAAYTGATRAARVVAHIKRRVVASLTICGGGDDYTSVDAKEPNSFHDCQDPDDQDQVTDDQIVEIERGETVEAEYDPADLLNYWLEELDMSKMMLQKQGKNQQQKDEGCVSTRAGSINNRADKTEKRRSIIKLDSIEDDEMLAILGDLTVLQSQLEDEIQCERDKREHFSCEIQEETQSLLRSSIELEEENIKAENIKIAIEKIKEASIKKLFIKVFTSDGSSKSLLVDETMRVSQVTQILAEKNLITLSPLWALVELVPELSIERVYEDHELLVENCLLWKADSKNTLWFMERPEKCDIFFRPEEYFPPKPEMITKQELFEEYFTGIKSSLLEVEGTLWLKVGKQKRWRKSWCVLRQDGVYYLPSKKKKTGELECLVTFAVNEVYYGVGWERRYRAPTEFCFGVKHPKIQARNSKNMRYFCVETEMELHKWVTGIRLAKHGQALCDNYQDILEDMAHVDIDNLNKRRSSLISYDCLKIFTKTGEQDRVDLTPSSENKSFDSAFSSGPGSEVSISGLNRKPEISLYASSSSGCGSVGCGSEGSSLSDITLGQEEDSLPLPPPPTAYSITSLNMVDALPPPPPSASTYHHPDMVDLVSPGIFHQAEMLDHYSPDSCSCPVYGQVRAKQEDTPTSARRITFDEMVHVIQGEEQTSERLVFDRDCRECREESLTNRWCLNKSDLYDVIGRQKTTFKTFFEDVWFEDDRNSSHGAGTDQLWHTRTRS